MFCCFFGCVFVGVWLLFDCFWVVFCCFFVVLWCFFLFFVDVWVFLVVFGLLFVGVCWFLMFLSCFLAKNLVFTYVFMYVHCSIFSSRRLLALHRFKHHKGLMVRTIGFSNGQSFGITTPQSSIGAFFCPKKKTANEHVLQ